MKTHKSNKDSIKFDRIVNGGSQEKAIFGFLLDKLTLTILWESKIISGTDRSLVFTSDRIVNIKNNCFLQ